MVGKSKQTKKCENKSDDKKTSKKPNKIKSFLRKRWIFKLLIRLIASELIGVEFPIDEE